MMTINTISPYIAWILAKLYSFDNLQLFEVVITNIPHFTIRKMGNRDGQEPI